MSGLNRQYYRYFIIEKLFSVRSPKEWLTNYLLKNRKARKALMIWSWCGNVKNFVPLVLDYYGIK